jgi:hypothetical protein
MFPAHSAHRAGFSRLQAIFGTVVLLILLAVLGTTTASYLKLHGTAHAIESARTLNTLLAQYATDNDGVYPTGEGTRAPGKSEGIALDLLLNSYTPNADIFTVGATPRYSGNAKDYADLAAENMSWDFTAGANVTTGIKSDAPDLLPVLFTTGEMIGLPGNIPGTTDMAPDVNLSGKGPFARAGMIVAYKAGNVEFLASSPKGDDLNLCLGVVSPKLKGTGTYTQIKP